MSVSLEDLLARATAMGMTDEQLPPEVKAAAIAAGLMDDDTDDAEQASLEAEVADLRARLAVLEGGQAGGDDVERARAAAEAERDELVEAPQPRDFDEDLEAMDAGGEPAEPTGVDFDDLPDLEDEPTVGDVDAVTPTEPTAPEAGAGGSEEKAAGWQVCPSCGSADADVYANGTARCEDCGTTLERKDDGDLERKAVSPVDDELASAAEIDLLLHRRADLDDA